MDNGRIEPTENDSKADHGQQCHAKWSCFRIGAIRHQQMNESVDIDVFQHKIAKEFDGSWDTGPETQYPLRHDGKHTRRQTRSCSHELCDADHSTSPNI